MSGKFFENGAIVVAIWPDGSGSETKATFQYESDADDFCRAPRDKGGPIFVRVSTYDASVRAFPPEPTDER